MAKGKPVHLVTYNGTTQSIKKWSKEVEICYGMLYTRIVRRKWDVKRALTTPQRKYIYCD